MKIYFKKIEIIIHLQIVLNLRLYVLTSFNFEIKRYLVATSVRVSIFLFLLIIRKSFVYFDLQENVII